MLQGNSPGGLFQFLLGHFIRKDPSKAGNWNSRGISRWNTPTEAGKTPGSFPVTSLTAHSVNTNTLKLIYSEKSTNFCEISTVDLSYLVTVKSTVEISQNFVAFSEYMNFKSCSYWCLWPIWLLWITKLEIFSNTAHSGSAA